MKIRALLGIILSIISVFCDNNWSPSSDVCQAIGTTTRNLSNEAVIFVELENFQITFEVALREAYDFSSIRIRDRALILETFYKCYGARGGLIVKQLSFRMKNNKCKMIGTSFEDYKELGFRNVHLILSGDLNRTCGGEKKVREEIFNKIQINSQKTTVRVMDFCMFCPDTLPYNFSSPKDLVKFTSDAKFYEHLEQRVDLLAAHGAHGARGAQLNWTEPSDSKYLYFTSIPATEFSSWPAFLAVLLVIHFFFLCLILCCCGLFMFTLVEEDFRHRNDEAEWLAMQLRRQEHFELVELAEPSMHTAKSETDMSTAKSESRDSLASTQDSETISGPVDEELSSVELKPQKSVIF